MTDQEAQIHALQEEITRLHEQLVEQEGLASIGALVPGVTHEVNTPLGVCVTSLSFLIDELKEVDEQFQSGELTEQLLRDYFDSCHEVTGLLRNNLQRAARLIHSFKAVAANQALIEIREFKLHELLVDIINSLRHETRRYVDKVELVCDAELKLTSDAGALTQVFNNLLINSVRHGFAEENSLAEQGKIKIVCQKQDGQLQIIYRDNGKGIPEVIAEHVFDPYFTTRRGSGGTGLGLAIARELMEKRLSGSIVLQPASSGVQFILHLPLSTNDESIDKKGK
ncbi:MAG: hypothetical protein CMI12_16055 [Oceanospirillum sp.]|nr:hypothetical protein [Oceanospirillum sp.]